MLRLIFLLEFSWYRGGALWMRFYIDILKGEEGKSIGPRRLHKERLIQRMVQVKGKNGGTYSRMQWVDPRGDMPEPKQSHIQSNVENGPPHNSDLTDQVHKLVNKMSKEEKYEWLDKHGIQWKRNAHPSTDHIEAVKALKKFLAENPHHLDLEHVSRKNRSELDIESESDKLMNPVDKMLNRKSKEEKWELISKYNIQWKENSNDKINRMHAFSALKQYLKDNLELAGLGEEDFDKARSMGDEVERVKQVGELVREMSPKLKMGLVKQYNIEPQSVGDDNIDNINRSKAITKFLSENSKELEFVKGKLEKHKLKNMKISVKQMMAIIRRLGKLTPKDIIASKEDKEWTFNDASMASVNEDDNGNPVLSIIDAENGKWEVKDIPMKDVKDFLENLEGTRSKAKEAPKYGKEDIIGLLKTMHGKPQVKKMAEGLWVFRADYGDAGEVKIDPEGVTLSIPNEDWEKTWSHEEVQSILEKYYRPLHEKSIDDIKEALDEDFDKFYKGKVKERIENSVRDDLLMHNTDYIEYTPQKLSENLTFGQGLLEKVAKEHAFWNPTKNDLDVYSDEFSEFMYKSLVESEKSRNAMEYVVTTFGRDNSWVLKESARHWEPIERRKARKEMWSSYGRVSSEFSTEAKGQISKHFNIVTGHLPFDIIADSLIKHGVSIKAPTSDKESSPIFSYDPTDHKITIPYTCTDDADFLSTEDPYEFHPSVSINGKFYNDSSLGSTLTHEFGHAIDHFFAGGGSNTMTHWQGSKEAMKYLGKHSNALFESYSKSVGEASGDSGGSACSKRGDYYVHDDKFLSPYEGRIYAPINKETGLPIGLRAVSYTSSSVIDDTFKGATEPPKEVIWGCEHWSESVSKYAAAAHHYFKYRQETKGEGDSKSFPQWCTEASKKYHEVKVNFDSKNELEMSHPDLHSAFRYKHMEQYHPIMSDAIDHLLNRGDFPPKLGSNEVRTRYTTKIGPNKKGQGRKSNVPIITPKTAKSLTFYIYKGDLM